MDNNTLEDFQNITSSAIDSIEEPIIVSILEEEVGNNEILNLLPPEASGYSKNRQILIIQCVCIFLLICLKFLSHCTRFKFKGAQVKIQGALLMS